MLQSLNSALPWNWNSVDSSSVPKQKKKHIRTRADQLAQNGDAQAEKVQDDVGYYPGLVNLSGTYCFMNSTMQALASLSYLQPHVDAIHDKAEALDVPTPVVDALRELLHTLNEPQSYHRAIRPEDMIKALSNPEPGKKSPLFSSREHQDAQELFQLVTEYIKKEAAAVDKEGHRDRGLGALASGSSYTGREVAKGVFDGLTANRRSCVECGYTEAVMHFSFDNWQLSVPRLAASCRLEDCLSEYTKLELLTDCMCRNCSMQATLKRLEEDAERLAEATHTDPDASASKKKRVREAKRFATRVRAAVEEGRIEEDIKGVKMERVFSRAHTKQAMIARPPPVLALHLNRSMHYGAYATKNTCRVSFPELLDLTPFTTSGKLSTTPSLPLSSSSTILQRSTAPSPVAQRVLYRLSAVVCHYGQHSFGHYVCFRRKPRPPALATRRFAPPRVAHFLGCECADCQRYGYVRDGYVRDGDDGARSRWLRISDDSVSECGIESVLAEGSGAFMLYYERVVQPPSVPIPKESEETLKPDGVLPDVPSSSVGSRSEEPERIFGARIVRSVSAQRRSRSVVSGREASVLSVESEQSFSEVSDATEPPRTSEEASERPQEVSIPARSAPPTESALSPSRIDRTTTTPRVVAALPSPISPSRTVGLRA
ncbi:cysteine proteinase [Artomyces pyxidatus]|uniref:Cysteine proteinase n=1 Tax=Artomyces pyxidatus TaxID=48021 RepID=A0ACB8TCC6_9AGAM|nr:cysteine proteinase [Artomyces pyxidatus]